MIKQETLLRLTVIMWSIAINASKSHAHVLKAKIYTYQAIQKWPMKACKLGKNARKLVGYK